LRYFGDNATGWKPIPLTQAPVQAVRDLPLQIDVRTASGDSRILIGPKQLDAASWLEGLPGEHAVIVTDSNVAVAHLPGLMSALEKRLPRVHSITIPAGEESKSVELLWRLWEQLGEFGADRQTVIVALGGGVAGDLAGFAAATWMRGVPLVQIPTTLLAQVDSSVGGKTGINLPSGKNLVGVFWQPRLVVIDPEVLSTLPRREYVAGLAEVVKYAMVFDAGFMAWLETNITSILSRDANVLVELIASCCRFKAAVVEADERDQSGRRALLNYGHTFGHALEAVAGYGTILHGEAVAIGMICAAWLAVETGLLNAADLLRQRALLKAFLLPPMPDRLPAEQLIAAMKRDKKCEGGLPKLVLPTAVGAARLVEWPGDGLVARAWQVFGEEP
jgi:3-dehydroquinate synthase